MQIKMTATAIATGLSFLGCGGSGATVSGGRSSSEDLGRAVMEALSKRDKTAFMALYATTEAVMTACPDMADKRDKLTKRMANTLELATASFDSCLAFDWSKAKPVSAEGGDSRGADDKCPSLVTLRDYVVEADIEGKRVELRLEDPLKLGNGHFLDDKLECRLASSTIAADKAPAPAGAAVPPPAEPVVQAQPAPAPVPPPPAPPVAPAAAPAQVDFGPVCNQFVAAYQGCLGLINEAARQPLLQALESMTKSWAGLDAASRDASCQQSKESMKQGLGAMCPGLFD